MFSDKYVFRSAFTTDGWIEPSQNNLTPRTLVFYPGNTNKGTAFWQDITSAISDAEELYIDPFAPNRLEGFSGGGKVWLLWDHLHPRQPSCAPFFDSIQQCTSVSVSLSSDVRQQGSILLQRQQEALRSARDALLIARTFLGENLRISARALRVDRISLRADELFAKYIPDSSSGTPVPHSYTRFFSALSAGGRIFCRDTLLAKADTIIRIEDDCGAAARMLLYLLYRKATLCGESLCIGRCPLFWPDKIDHLLFCDRRILFTTGNRYHRLHSHSSRIDCANDLMYSLNSAEKEQLHRNRLRSERLFDHARRNLREVYRLQTAAAELWEKSLLF